NITNSSDSSCLSASRIGILLTPINSASSVCTSLSPGLKSPFIIALLKILQTLLCSISRSLILKSILSDILESSFHLNYCIVIVLLLLFLKKQRLFQFTITQTVYYLSDIQVSG